MECVFCGREAVADGHLERERDEGHRAVVMREVEHRTPASLLPWDEVTTPESRRRILRYQKLISKMP